VAEGTVKVSDLTSFWGAADAIDKKRVEAEQQAFDKLVAQAAVTWAGIARQYHAAAGSLPPR
jgi:hypothetical protein